jgi:hypothetical protein
MSHVHNSLNCHRNVNEQTNPLQEDDLITINLWQSLKPLEEFWTHTHTRTHTVKISVLANTSNVYKHHDLQYIISANTCSSENSGSRHTE